MFLWFSFFVPNNCNMWKSGTIFKMIVWLCFSIFLLCWSHLLQNYTLLALRIQMLKFRHFENSCLTNLGTSMIFLNNAGSNFPWKVFPLDILWRWVLVLGGFKDLSFPSLFTYWSQDALACFNVVRIRVDPDLSQLVLSYLCSIHFHFIWSGEGSAIAQVWWMGC